MIETKDFAAISKIPLEERYPREKSDIDDTVKAFAKGLRMAATLMGIAPEDPHVRANMGRYRKTVTLTRELVMKHPDLLEDQRKGIGEGYSHAGPILLMMKEAVAKRLYDPEGATVIEREVFAHFNHLRSIHMVEDEYVRFMREVGQEVGEMVFHNRVFFDTLFYGTPLPVLPPTSFDLNIYPQTWLATLADSVGEISKTLRAFLAQNRAPLDHRYFYELRFYTLANAIVDFLNLYIAKYPLVINNSRRRGFRSTFRGMVQSAEFVLEHHVEKILELQLKLAIS